MNIGTNVKLTDQMNRAVSHPEKYGRGVVTKTCTHGIVEIQWDGIDHPICMRLDEIEPAQNHPTR